MCAAGAATPSADPGADYDGETAAALTELVASEPLDPSITDGAERNVAAADAIWARWRDEGVLIEARWDEMGVGETTCGADDRLYATAILRDGPSMAATGRYSTNLYTSTQITAVTGIQYGTATDHLGEQVPLLLDLYLPPAGPSNRPVVVAIHGGGFTQGSRTNTEATARAFARQGFVVASIDYRLRPDTNPGEADLAAALDAIDDGMESVRWLKANAASYAIDPARIGLTGTSAGGAIALGIALADDPTPGGPLAAYTPDVAAAMSTGAHLTPALDLVGFQPSDDPVLMFHYEQDTSELKATGAYAYETCTAARAAGSTCDFVLQPGTGHTVNLSPAGPFWRTETGPFLWEHLDLASLPQ
jgi:poly(3-hydroxybutyrate) depolymerase